METGVSARSARAFNPKFGPVRAGLAGSAAFECATAQRERCRGACAEKQSSDFRSSAQCAGFGTGDAGSAVESLATSLWQPDRGRCPKQQPHHRRGIEQSNRLRASCWWRYGKPTDHRLRAHDKSGRQRTLSGKSRRAKRSRHEAGRSCWPWTRPFTTLCRRTPCCR